MTWDNLELLRRRNAVLSNGGRLPLADAADHFQQLQILRQIDDLEWDAVYFLREVALGRRIDPEPLRVLVREQLLDGNGDLDPGFRDVILSAVRGEGRHLTLVSPFTTDLDRMLAEYDTARQVIRLAGELGELDPALTREFLAPSRFDRAEEELKRRRRAARSDDAGPPAPDAPPPATGSSDAKTFADRVKKKPDAPPSPPHS